MFGAALKESTPDIVTNKIGRSRCKKGLHMALVKWREVKEASKADLEGGRPTLQCQKNTCRCENGSPRTGDACTEDGAHLCGKCNDGYRMARKGQACYENVCVCANGSPLTAKGTCPVHGMTFCEYCDPGFEFNENDLSCKQKVKCEVAHCRRYSAACYLGRVVGRRGDDNWVTMIPVTMIIGGRKDRPEKPLALVWGSRPVYTTVVFPRCSCM